MNEPDSVEAFIQNKGLDLVTKELTNNFDDKEKIVLIFKIIDQIISKEEAYKELFAVSDISSTIDKVISNQGFDKKLEY